MELVLIFYIIIIKPFRFIHIKLFLSLISLEVLDMGPGMMARLANPALTNVRLPCGSALAAAGTWGVNQWMEGKIFFLCKSVFLIKFNFFFLRSKLKMVRAYNHLTTQKIMMENMALKSTFIQAPSPGIIACLMQHRAQSPSSHSSRGQRKCTIRQISPVVFPESFYYGKWKQQDIK